MIRTLTFATVAVLAAAPALAQQQGAEPIEITASKSVEWLRGQNQYVAREDVVVTQGKMTIASDLLTADYRDVNGATEIWQLTAEGNVSIRDENNKAYGEKGVYDVPAGIAILTGQQLRLVSPEQTVTASERMEYHAATREAKAVGNAKVVRGRDTLTADTISAFFIDGGKAGANTPAPSATGPASPTASAGPAKPAGSDPLGGTGSNLDRLEAQGHVVIKTPTETLYGERAIYRAATNTAELIGKVRVERGQNTLEGARAEVNLATSVSKMFGSEKGGRVRGIFFPGSEKKPGAAGSPATPKPPSALPPVAPKAVPNVPVPPAAPVIFNPPPTPVPGADSAATSPASPPAAPVAAQNPASQPPARPATVGSQ